MSISSDGGTVAETELAFEGRACDEDDSPVQTSLVQTDFLLQNTSAEHPVEEEAIPHSNLALVVTSSVLLAFFLILMASFTFRQRSRLLILLKRRRDSENSQRLPSLNAGPNNQSFAQYLQAAEEETHRPVPVISCSSDNNSFYV